jgi:hypothetical protein
LFRAQAHAVDVEQRAVGVEKHGLGFGHAHTLLLTWASIDGPSGHLSMTFLRVICVP